MAGGPFWPHSAFPAQDEAFPNFHNGDGAFSDHDEGLGIAADQTADAIWELRWLMPPTLPSGTAKLRIISLADAITGDLQVNPKWVSVAMGADPSSTSLNAEGTTEIAWNTDDDDTYIETKITLDADTIVADEMIVMDLVFEDTDATLGQISTHMVSMVFE